MDVGLTDLLDAPTPPRRRRRWRRVLVGLLVCVLVFVGVAAVGAWYVDRQLLGRIDRISGAFAGIADRPVKPPAARAATTILLVGTDRRSAVPTTGEDAQAPTWLPGAQRADSMMVVHVSADRDDVTVVSIPRDSWVEIPGFGRHKVNAAFSLGGPALTVRTVEALTDVRIDHLAVVDWAGFRGAVDALGGVTVDVPATVYDAARDRTWTAGRHHLDGADALSYVGQRYGLPGGDLDRVRRQQYVLRQLLGQLLAAQLWTDPIRGYRILDAVTANLAIDDTWTTGQLRHLAVRLSRLDADAVRFTSAPVAGFGREGAESVVRLAPRSGRTLWRALAHDRAPAWFAAHPGAALPASVD